MKNSIKKICAGIMTATMIFSLTGMSHIAHAEVVWDPNSGNPPYDNEDLSFDHYLNGTSTNSEEDEEHQRVKQPFVDDEGNKHYYMLFGFASSVKDRSWQAARERCIKMHGHLATITSEREENYICNNYLVGVEWIGLHRDGDGKWKWVTGEEYDPDDAREWGWNDGEPNGSTKETCGVTYTRRWNDLNHQSGECSQYFCEWDQYTDDGKGFEDAERDHYTIMSGENDIRHINSLNKQIQPYGLTGDEDTACGGMFTGYKYKLTYSFNNQPGAWTDDISVIPPDKNKHVAMNVYVKQNSKGGIANMIFADQIIKDDGDRDNLSKNPLYIVKVLKKDSDDQITNIAEFLEKHVSSSLAKAFRSMNQQILEKNTFFEFARGETSVETFSKRIKGYQKQALDDFFGEAAKRAKLLYGVDIKTDDLENLVWKAMQDGSDLSDISQDEQQAVSSYLPYYEVTGDYSTILKNCTSAEDAKNKDLTFKDEETDGSLALQLAGIFNNVGNYILYNNSLQWYTTCISMNDESLSLYLDTIVDFADQLNYSTGKSEDKLINMVNHKEHTMDNGVCSYCGETQEEVNAEAITSAEKHGAKKVKTSIQELPAVDTLTLDNKDDVKKVADAYNELNVKQQAIIDDTVKNKLISAQNKIKQLTNDHNQSLIDLENQIMNLPSPQHAQLSDLEAFSKAQSTFYGLSEEDQKVVDDAVNKQIGQTARSYIWDGIYQIDHIKEEEEETKAQQESDGKIINDRVKKMPDPNSLSQLDDNTLASYKTECQTLLDDYNQLSNDGKSCVSADHLTKLQNLVTNLNQITKQREDQRQAAIEAEKKAEEQSQKDAIKITEEKQQQAIKEAKERDAKYAQEQEKVRKEAEAQEENEDKSQSDEDESKDATQSTSKAYVTKKKIYTKVKKVTLKGKKTITFKQKNAKWYSSNSKIATVKKGKVAFKKKGSVTIQAQTSSKVYTYKVTYKPGVLKVNKKKVLVKMHKSVLVKVTKNSPKTKVHWSAKNKKVAKVKNGKITGLKKGKTIVFVKANDQVVKIKVVVA